MIDVIIIGSGPAGLMAANRLEDKKINYLLFDKNNNIGRKLLITGGTRCNVTNNYNVKEFIEQLKIKNKRFLYSTLSNFGTKHIINFFESKGVELMLEKEYQYFPKSSKSSDIVAALLQDIDQKKLIMNTAVIDIIKENDYYIVETKNKDYYAKNVIIATGSKSYPKTGSTGDGVIFGKQLGHHFMPFYPAETHVYSDYVKKNKEYLQGISLLNCNVTIKGMKKVYKGGLIFTHYGLSGPVIQNISELIYFETLKNETEVFINLTTNTDYEIKTIFELKANQKVRVIRVIEKLTIKRLARFIMKELKFAEEKVVANLSKIEISQITEKLLRFSVKIARVESISNAYINGGGILTEEINPKTMESKISKGLFFIGETLNLHGPIGGFNITIAFSTGYSAADSLGSDD